MNYYKHFIYRGDKDRLKLDSFGWWERGERGRGGSESLTFSADAIMNDLFHK